MPYAVETAGLTKRFGGRPAVENLDLRVPRGAVFGFLGQNGAGKSTTIRLLLGLLKPDAGVIRIFGRDLARHRLEAAQSVGALVETPFQYDHLTGRENLDITRRLLGLPDREADRVLELVGLASAADRMAGGYSLGMRQRLGVARALLGSPKLLILDEPTNGLDPEGILAMRAMLASLPERAGTTVLLSSHMLSEVEQVATHIGLMQAGHLLLQGPIAEVRMTGDRQIRFTVDEPDRAVAVLAQRGIPSRVGNDRIVCIDPGKASPAAWSVPDLNALLVANGIGVEAIEVREPSLEDIFRRATAVAQPPKRAA